MVKPVHILKGAVAALCLWAATCVGAASQESDLRDEGKLLEKLRSAAPDEAINLERQLKALWSQSGSAAMDLLLKRGRDALEVKDFEVAVGHLTALTDHAPEFAEGWFARATAFFMMNLYGPSVADLERTLHLNPNHYEAIMGLAMILESVGEADLAYEAFTRAASIHPHHESVTNAIERLEPRVGGKEL